MSDYVTEYQANPKVLGTIDGDGTFIAEAEVVDEEFSRINTALNDDYVQMNGAAQLRGEVRVVDPGTGGMKGSKLARFDMIPPDVLWELAEHYGKGEAKYPSDPETGEPNWQKGYSWRLSVAALERHLNLWKQGEDFDPETGSSHLIAVMWHASALRWFQLHGRGKDYRDVANAVADAA